MRPGLSKSKLTAFLQCPKRLWLSVRKPGEAQWSPTSQSSLDMGNQVGELARAEHPDGVLVDTGNDMAAAVAMTRELMRSPDRPIFEGTFEADGVLVRADLMLPAGDGRYDLHEVKAATRLAEKYVNDAAIQGWVLRAAAAPLRTVHVRLLDRSFVYPGDGRYQGLFTSHDVDAPCASIGERVPAWIQGARATLESAEPALAMGAHCQSPNTCPFIGYCGGDTINDEGGSRTNAPSGPAGSPDLPAAPDPALATVDHAGARAEMAKWPTGPRHFLDFETVALAVPRWAGTSPYQRIPFQFSCQVEDGRGHLRHESFLDLSGDSPAAGCAEALVRAIGPQGAVVAYGASAERSAISALAALVPAHREALLAIHERVVDLLPVARHHYRHPALASYSLKDVLPTVAPALAHSRLRGVKTGQDAQLAYVQATAPGTPAGKQAIIAEELAEYCALDTLAMVEVVKRLEQSDT
jgi:hypothetical protein